VSGILYSHRHGDFCCFRLRRWHWR